MFPTALYGCETSSLTLREEHGLGVFENRVLRRIFGQNRDQVTRGWRKLHNEKLHNLYSLPNIFRMMTEQAGSTGNSSDLYSLGTGFKSRLEHRVYLLTLLVVLLSLSGIILRQHPNQATTNSFSCRGDPLRADPVSPTTNDAMSLPFRERLACPLASRCRTEENPIT
jgi:hypothetical protein